VLSGEAGDSSLVTELVLRLSEFACFSFAFAVRFLVTGHILGG